MKVKDEEIGITISRIENNTHYSTDLNSLISYWPTFFPKALFTYKKILGSEPLFYELKYNWKRGQIKKDFHLYLKSNRLDSYSVYSRSKYYMYAY